eukprot:TRINITY_DN14509_c0_g1_i3.p1 TRINITY_DN14509_c0_g1~~TRINITY_DN14509_c0_g1_i3.p1  ORF type:complete len:129 (+),score=6.04 TRINITY_DN14509_c0_g1_i3:72-458(+)
MCIRDSINIDREKRNCVCKALRFMCHTNGCAVIMTAVTEQATMNNLKTMMLYFLFNGDPGDSINTEYTKPLYVPVGADSLANIGEPKVIYFTISRALRVWEVRRNHGKKQWPHSIQSKKQLHMSPRWV